MFEFITFCLCFQKSNAWFENVGSYRKKFIQGTDKFVRPIEMFEFSSIRIIDFFVWKGLVGSRDQQICSTSRDVRVSEYSSYRESTVTNCIVECITINLFQVLLDLKILGMIQPNPNLNWTKTPPPPSVATLAIGSYISMSFLIQCS